MSRFLPLLIGVALVVFFFVGLQRDPRVIPSPYIGKAAPDFDLPSLQDPSVRVRRADFLGKPFVINVWGTWCVGCRQEHDVLMAVAEQSILPLIGINWRDDRAQALAWLRQTGNPYGAIGFDPDGRAAIDWGVYGAPETFLIDAGGTVLYKHIGPLDMASWEREFIARLK